MEPSKRPSAFRLMLTPEEHEVMRAIAADAGVTMSSLIRRLIFGEEYEAKSSMYPREDFSGLLEERIERLSKYKSGPWPVR